MNRILIVTAAADERFATEVRDALVSCDVEIASTIQVGEQTQVLLVWSAASRIGPGVVPTLVERWSAGRLTIARRDDTSLPLGLGDLDALPADMQASQIASRLMAGETYQPGMFMPSPPSVAESAATSAAPGRRGRLLAGTVLVFLLVLGAGAVLLNSTLFPSVIGKIDSLISADGGARSRGFPSDPNVERQRRIDELERQLQDLRRQRAAETPWETAYALPIAGGFAIVTLSGVGIWAYRRRRRQDRERPAEVPSPAPRAVAADDSLFVSYAHRDATRVDAIVAEIEKLGRLCWIDRTGMTGGPGWAGQIARAIKASRAVVLMASASAYASDQVVRELYLAMGNRKIIVPIELEPAELPDELAYILAPFQRHALSEGDTQTLLARALEHV